MARPRKSPELASFAPPITTTPGSQPPSAFPAIFSPEPTTQERREAEVEDILESLGTDGRVTVYHVIEGRTSYAGDMTTQGFSLENLIDTYGGGEKLLVFFAGGKKVESARVSLDPSIPPTSPRERKLKQERAAATANGLSPYAVSAPASPSTDLVGMMQAQANQFQVLMQSQQQQAQLMMTTLTTVMTAMLSQKSDPMDMAVRMTEVLKGAGSGAPSIDSALTLLDRGLAIGARMNGSEDDGVMSMVGKGLDTLSVIVKGMIESKQQSGVVATPGGATVRTGTPLGAVPAESTATAAREEDLTMMGGRDGAGDRSWVGAVRPSIGFLAMASTMVTPDAAAERIVDSLSDEAFADLIADMHTPDFAERLQAYFPGAFASVNPEWVGAVLGAILDYEPESTTEPGAVSAMNADVTGQSDSGDPNQSVAE